VNGSQVSSVAVSGALTASTSVLRMRGSSIWGEFFAGLLDDVRVYNRALTAAEVLRDRAAQGQAGMRLVTPWRGRGRCGGR
jgi:hypothetical protein